MTNKNTLDYVRVTKNTKTFILPPKHIETKGYEDCLPEIVKDKVRELKDRLNEIRKTYYKEKKKDYSAFVSRFYNYCYQEEKLFIEIWLEYWKSLIKPKLVSNRTGITNDDIKKAKEFPIEKLYIGNLRQSGERLIGLCPFHEEKTPSFFIFGDNHFHCYGCQEHGDSISFLMKTENISFVGAVKELGYA